MKIAIITSSEFSYASLLLREQLPEGIELVLILNETPPRSKLKLFKKIFRVGLPGIAMGYASRNWYKSDFDSVITIALEKGIRMYCISNFEVEKSVEDTVRECDFGISMGNGYIPGKFFMLFRHGMINIHHEILPEYAGAQSVVWPIIENKTETGFSIHFISSKIDQGDIIISEKRPIVFYKSFGKTVRYNYQESLRLSIIALLTLLRKPICEWTRVTNTSESNFTTPSIRNWIMAYRNFTNLKSKM